MLTIYQVTSPKLFCLSLEIIMLSSLSLQLCNWRNTYSQKITEKKLYPGTMTDSNWFFLLSRRKAKAVVGYALFFRAAQNAMFSLKYRIIPLFWQEGRELAKLVFTFSVISKKWEMVSKAHHESDAHPQCPQGYWSMCNYLSFWKGSPVGIPGLLYSRMEDFSRLASMEKFCGDPGCPWRAAIHRTVPVPSVGN